MLFPPFILHVIFPESLTQHVKIGFPYSNTQNAATFFYRNSLPLPEVSAAI